MTDFLDFTGHPSPDSRTWRGVLRDYLTIRGRGKRYVTDSRYGARPDDPTFDNVPAIQAAINDSEPGDDVILPFGRYHLKSRTQFGGLAWHLYLFRNNVRMVGPGTLVSDRTDTTTISFMNHLSWIADRMTFRAPFPIEAATRYERDLRLVNASDALSFSVGDIVLIRSGQTLSGSAIHEPDGELNEIANVSGNVLRLRAPLAKDYAQEYYVTGSTGRTSTVPTPNPAPFGVVNVTDIIRRDVGLDNIAFDAAGDWSLFNGGQVVGLELTRLSGRTGGTIQSMGVYARALISDWRFHVTGSGPVRYALAAATITNDVTIENVIVDASNRVIQLHVHEGVSDLYARHVRLRSTHRNADENAVSVRARAYNIQLRDFDIIDAGSVPVYIDPTCRGGGLITGFDIRGAYSSPNAIHCHGDGWVIGPCNLHGKQIISDSAAHGNTPPKIVSYA